MAVEEMITSLPIVSAATMQDIIYAVQGYVSPSVLGTSVQETLQQVYNLFQSTIILYNSGDPNGVVAGTTYQLLWDTLDNVLWVCTTSGTSSTAVWQQCVSPQSNWVAIITGTQAMTQNKNYVCNNGASLITFTLPTTASFGTIIEVSGFSSGGWTIAQNAAQTVNFGSTATTSGIGGSLSSSNRYDYIKLLCVTADLTWNVVGSIGNITIV